MRERSPWQSPTVTPSLRASAHTGVAIPQSFHHPIRRAWACPRRRPKGAIHGNPPPMLSVGRGLAPAVAVGAFHHPTRNFVGASIARPATIYTVYPSSQRNPKHLRFGRPMVAPTAAPIVKSIFVGEGHRPSRRRRQNRTGRVSRPAPPNAVIMRVQSMAIPHQCSL